jgi:hypothetical protein
MKSLEENIDYEMIPGAGENWDIRILTGEFTETVINYKRLQVSNDGEHLTFNFEIVSSPDEGLDAETNLDLQNTAAMVLSNILENSVTRENNKSD